MPVGDKLKAGQPFRVTEKYKPKSEQIPKSSSNSIIDTSGAILIGGLAIAKLGGMGLLGYGISALGGVLVAIDFMELANPYRKIFERTKIQIDGVIPKLKRKRKTDYGYCLEFNLPVGLSTHDFERNKLAIEQYLNKKIDISYKNHRVFIRVFEKELDKLIPYEFIETKGTLEFPIGKVLGDKIITVDLGEVVHLLVAGETGSGKSTLLRGVLTSIILGNKKVSLHLIDLKNGAEFNVFRKCKSVKSFSRDISEAHSILGELLAEVDKRYDLFYENDVVDIKEFNRLKGVKKLNYQVVVIDEFADFKKEKKHLDIIETLAAKARACGIHLIISTQRPDREILNGRIKANIPCAIGLKTLNEVNSRIIIDEGGLEKLRGKGNGLLKYEELIEFQSMYITNEQARGLVRHTYIEKSVKITKEEEKEEVAEIKDFGFLKALEGGKK